MGAAAVAARIPLRAVARPRSAVDCGLAFDRPGGPLVAVCGLVGGAGTSTLALLLAQQVAAESAAPVLLTESRADRAGLALLAGHTTPHSLAALARQVAEDDVSPETFIEVEPGLRLIASAPRDDAPAEAQVMRALLGQACDAHGLVIIDCGTNWTGSSTILERASHIIWTLPATAAGMASARVLLDSRVLPPAGRSREVVVATARDPRPAVSVRVLRRMAQLRCERLVLIPHSGDLARGQVAVDQHVARPITGLAATLRRMR